MIERLLAISLRNRGIVLIAALCLCVVGAFRASRMPVDVFPDLTAPRVTIVTESTGMAAVEVERLISFPIEAAVNGAAGLRRVRSASAAGISVVWAEFDWQTSPTEARQRITERLQSAMATLPPGAEMPLLAPAASAMGEIAFVALTSPDLDPIALRRIADVDVRRRLLGVEGIAQVVPIGGGIKQYQVIVDPLKLEAHSLTAAEVSAALSSGNSNAPGGYVVEQGQESVVRVLGRAHGVTDLENVVVVERDGSSVRVRDVANVRVGAAPARGTASYRAGPAVMLTVVKQPEADTVSTTTRLDRELDLLEKDLAPRGVVLNRDVFRQQDFIDTAIGNVMGVLRDGAVLVVLVLFLFMWSMRPTLISALAIPLSLLAAALVLDLAGMTLDTMTLGGFAIAIGELVDDAIVDVENVARRLRERHALPEAERPTVLATVFQASREIRASIVSATYILMLVFVPLLLLDGLEGKLLRPLSIAYLVAIFASLVVAVTVTPVLCSFFLVRRGADAAAEPPLMRFLSRCYQPLLMASVRKPRAVLAGALVVVLVGAGALSRMGRSFLPEFNEGNVTIAMVLTPGTALAESDALGAMAERALLADPAVTSVGRRTGRAERDEHVLGVESSELEVRLDPDDSRTKEEVFADLRQRLRAVPGAHFTLGQPISHRIEHMISGQRAALAIKLFGEDLGALRKTAEQVESAIQDVPGLVDLGVEQIVDVPEIVVDVDRERAAAHGLSAGAAASRIGALLWGNVATRVYEDGTTVDVVVKQDPTLAKDLDALSRMRLATPSGAAVPVSALAEIRRDIGPNYVLREKVERRIALTANVDATNSSRVIEEVQARIAKRVKRPDGVRIEYAGTFQRASAANRSLFLYGSLAMLGIALIVLSTLGSLRRTLIVLFNLPLALVGGTLGVYLAGGVLSVATTIGFITLFGIATRNGILLATRSRDLELSGSPRAEAVTRAAQERLAPILMTAVTAALGLLPLALAAGQPGSEIQAPMALVILCGLSTSTLLNMLVVPALLARWGGAAGDADASAGGQLWIRQHSTPPPLD